MSGEDISLFVNPRFLGLGFEDGVEEEEKNLSPPPSIQEWSFFFFSFLTVVL